MNPKERTPKPTFHRYLHGREFLQCGWRITVSSDGRLADVSHPDHRGLLLLRMRDMSALEDVIHTLQCGRLP